MQHIQNQCICKKAPAKQLWQMNTVAQYTASLNQQPKPTIEVQFENPMVKQKTS